jgi:hypothetical protein
VEKNIANGDAQTRSRPPVGTIGIILRDEFEVILIRTRTPMRITPVSSGGDIVNHLRIIEVATPTRIGREGGRGLLEPLHQPVILVGWLELPGPFLLGMESFGHVDEVERLVDRREIVSTFQERHFGSEDVVQDDPEGVD